MAYGQVSADVINTSVSGSSLGAGNASIMKNRFINGAMMISQRNGTSTVTPAAGDYTLDRYRTVANAASKFSVAQSSDAPAGFVNSLLVTSLSAYSVASGDELGIQQRIEGYNISDLAWGTANAKTVTVSFWIKSSLTGSFGASLTNGSFNRWYPFSYTISSANTWTQVSVTIAGDTTGTWATNNTTGIQIEFGLGVGSTLQGAANAWTSSVYVVPTGSVSVVGTNAATWQLTGLQLEVGSSATGYEYRQYGQELALCQRYFEIFGRSGVGGSRTSALFTLNFPFAVAKRASPTIAQTTTFSLLVIGVASYTANSINASNPTTSGTQLDFNTSSGSTGTFPTVYGNGSASDVLTASAEL